MNRLPNGFNPEKPLWEPNGARERMQSTLASS
jgi:hypothetical protein